MDGADNASPPPSSPSKPAGRPRIAREVRKCVISTCPNSFEEKVNSKKLWCSQPCGVTYSWELRRKKYADANGSNGMPRKGNTVKCAIEECNNTFYKRPSSDTVTCSIECGAKYRAKPTEVRQCQSVDRKTGKQCEVTFQARYDRNQRFCSRQCGGRNAGYAQGPQAETRTCEADGCGKSFVPEYNASTKRFCSIKCGAYGGHRLTMEKRKCSYDGTEFECATTSTQKYCSETCKNRGIFRGLKEKKRCLDGHMVGSEGERMIDDWLFRNEIMHIYEASDQANMMPDWKVGDTYIEFVGGQGLENGRGTYDDNFERKKALYAERGLKVIYIFPKDLERIPDILGHLKKS